MSTLTIRRLALPAAVLIAAGSLVGLATGSAAADDSGVPIAGSHPAWASAANDAGAAPAAEPVLGQIVLKLRDPAGARQLALAVATPGSAAYRKAVTPRQWIDRFSPDAVRYASLVARLRHQGLTITGTPESRLYVTFTGTADQVAAAFDTPMHRYKRHGSLSTAPVVNAKLPASMATDVSSLDISDPVAHLRPASYQPGAAQHPGWATSASTGPAYDKPCSSFYGQYSERVPLAYGSRSFPTALCGYEPKQIRSAYGVDGLLAKGIDGRGLTIAFTDAFASPTLRADVNTFSAARGEPAVSLQQIVPDPSDYAEYDACGGESGWQVEQTLDAVALHDVAPKASLLYVGAADCDAGFEVALSTILDRRLADVVSNSWGAPDALVNGDDFVPGQVEAIGNLSLQAAAEGIGLYFCSGDEGDGTDLDGVTAPWFPASLPFVTAVGGTSVGIDAKGKVALETGWGSTFDAIVPDENGAIGYVDPLPGSLFFGGAGGGQSTLAAEPAYQRDLVPARLSGGQRAVPDIAALADGYTGLLIGIRNVDASGAAPPPGSYVEFPVGGTSVATPLVAGLAALSEQSSGQSIGFLNPALYGLAGANVEVTRDVLPATPRTGLVYGFGDGTAYLLTLDQDTTLKTRVGYDTDTGLGSATAQGMVRIANLR